MAVATRTLLQLCTAVADLISVRETGTLTAASTTALTAANYPFRSNRTDASNKKYEGDEVYLEAAAANVTPNPNGVAAYVASTGVFTPSNTYANAPGGTLTFDLFQRGVTRAMLIDAINETLRGLVYETRLPLTQVVDGDMETSADADWTESNATDTKVATAGNFEDGTQGMRVITSAALGYTQSATILVDPTNSPTWHVRAWVRADVGTARLVAYDVTNAANITTEDWALRGPGVLDFQFALPATCEALAFRLMGVANLDDTYWDNVIATPLSVRELTLPDWVTEKSMIRRVFKTSPDRPRADQRYFQELAWWDMLPDQSNPLGMFKLVMAEPTTGPIWIEAVRPYSTLTLDADTTFCPRDLIELGAQVNLLQRLVARAPGQEVTEWKKLLYGERSPDGVRNPGKLSEWKRLARSVGPSIISRNVM